MLLKVSWRNIWRSKVRSFVVITAIGLGLWAGIFASAFVEGMMVGKINSVIEKETSHVQFHVPGWRDEFRTGMIIKKTAEIRNKLKEDPRVERAAFRIVTNSMITSTTKNGSVRVMGVDTADEAIVTRLDEKLIEGDYFKGIKRNPILISREIADTYKIKLRSKVVITFLDTEDEIVSGAFRVVGIYKSDNGMYDKMHVFVLNRDLRRIAKIDTGAHEVAVKLQDYEMSEAVASEYQKEFSDLEVLPWLDVSTGMRYMVEVFDVYLYFIVGIILLALLFSIINTMYMAVLERVREIGMLMAIGMTKGRIFGMIMIETIIMTMIGCPLGLALSWLSIAWWGNTGINLSGAMYEDFGYGSIIYPTLDPARYIDVAIMVFVMALIAAIFPARKALKLKPVEAIRKI
jgi:ABC-type lipoprotein release transport system permease subunit